jgi:hypothetical protein
MRAGYLWRSGEFAGREIVLERRTRVEIGGAGDDRLAVPGAPPDRILAVVDFQDGRCYLKNLSASPLTLTRKASGRLLSVPVAPGERTETKSGDLLSLAEGEIYCQYELELSDRFGQSRDDLEEACSPISADRRKNEAPRKEDMLRLEHQLVQTRRGWNARLLTSAFGAAVLLVGAGALGLFLIRDTRMAVEARLAAFETQLDRQRAGYEENARGLEGAREDVRRELEKLKRNPAEPMYDESVFPALLKTIEPSLYLIGCWVRTESGEIHFSSGTGFLVEGGWLATCKHAVQPWKYPELLSKLERAGARVKETSFAAYPVGSRIRDESRAIRFDAAAVTAPPDRRYPGGAEVSVEDDVALVFVGGGSGPPLKFADEEEWREFARSRLAPVMIAGFPRSIVVGDVALSASASTGNATYLSGTIQHTAPTCRGNGGSPLVNARGRVVGLVTYSFSDPSHSLNLAVPIARLRELVSGKNR